MKLKIQKHMLMDRYCFALLALAIYCSHDTILFGTNSNDTFITVRKIVPFFLLACLMLTGRLKVLRKKDLYTVAVFVCLPLLSALVNGEALNNYIYRAVIMICAALFIWSGKERDLFLNFNSFMYFLSVWSVCTCVLANVAPAVTSMLPTVTNTAGAGYDFLLFSLVSKSGIYGLVRNTSIFREPGVLAVFVTFAFVIELTMVQQARMKHIAAYTAAMITTFSTAGYIILAFLYVYIFCFGRNVPHKGILAMLVAVVLMMVVLFTDILSPDGAIFGKFTAGVGNYGSWFARLSSLRSNWQIAVKNPIFGIGRYALYDTVLAVSGGYVAADNTNTMLINFSAYGMIFGVLSLWGLWRFVRLRQENLIAALMLTMILFMALSNEDLGQNVFYYCIILSGIAARKVAWHNPVDTEMETAA